MPAHRWDWEAIPIRKLQPRVTVLAPNPAAICINLQWKSVNAVSLNLSYFGMRKSPIDEWHSITVLTVLVHDFRYRTIVGLSKLTMIHN